jgi:hypothetical protein
VIDVTSVSPARPDPAKEIALTATVPTLSFARRRLLSTSGGLALSAGAVALIAGCSTAGAANPANDVAILNVALGLEHEAISAYQLGAQSGLLQKPVLDVAVAFQTHHKEHRDALVATIRKLGAANAYIGVIPSFEDKALAQVSSRLAADETMHWTALSSALGDQPPAKALSFGA